MLLLRWGRHHGRLGVVARRRQWRYGGLRRQARMQRAVRSATSSSRNYTAATTAASRHHFRRADCPWSPLAVARTVAATATTNANACRLCH